MLFKRNKLPKLRKGAWFVPVRWSYLPMTWQGYATYIPYTAYLFGTFYWVHSKTMSLPDTCIAVLPFWFAGIMVMTWFARHKS